MNIITRQAYPRSRLSNSLSAAATFTYVDFTRAAALFVDLLFVDFQATISGSDAA